MRKSTGFCSAHRNDGHLECDICYPQLKQVAQRQGIDLDELGEQAGKIFVSDSLRKPTEPLTDSEIDWIAEPTPFATPSAGLLLWLEADNCHQ